MPRKFYSETISLLPVLVDEAEEWQKAWDRHAAQSKRGRLRPLAIHLPALHLSRAFRQPKGWKMYQHFIDFRGLWPGEEFIMSKPSLRQDGIYHYHHPIPDPLYVPAVGKVLLYVTRPRVLSAPSVTAYLSTWSAIPLEIRYLIVQWLRVRDVLNMLLAFGETLSYSYWLRRLPTELLFGEIQDLATTAPDTVDWPYLAVLIFEQRRAGEVCGALVESTTSPSPQAGGAVC
ncbi:hypothetical protein ASPZODRAFT_26052 [Penicilliopsis zonata CBS 506.65]|uniref:Uncharacterized protein n=1 Tax=Penicilliopsis zonata CBS 506.65 TaxID=1073090 RepID=A0A1L9SGB2_9EURO|nr:hypothetical protein ASPZODRAFT_26052 [Penicilliopsis zonata CBS 506.65]OJJ46168.1 hypothetical protein ASPZODRAFT_26052 [Penicilliopsis zonata CBS 506.65]